MGTIRKLRFGKDSRTLGTVKQLKRRLFDARRRGFSVFELLVILALIAILISLLISALHRIRQAADRNTCANNLHNLGIATHNHQSTFGQLPAAMSNFDDDVELSFFFRLLPFIEQENLFKAAEGEEKKGRYNTWIALPAFKPVQAFLCPTDASVPKSHLFEDWLPIGNYVANYLVFETGGARINDIVDGTSNTLILTEHYKVCNGTPNSWFYADDSDWAPVFARANHAKFQLHPSQELCDPSRPQSLHRNGINIGMADGGVRFASERTPPEVWFFMCTPAGGEFIDWNALN